MTCSVNYKTPQTWYIRRSEANRKWFHSSITRHSFPGLFPCLVYNLHHIYRKPASFQKFYFSQCRKYSLYIIVLSLDCICVVMCLRFHTWNNWRLQRNARDRIWNAFCTAHALSKPLFVSSVSSSSELDSGTQWSVEFLRNIYFYGCRSSHRTKLAWIPAESAESPE